jgi:hypothetical protein
MGGRPMLAVRDARAAGRGGRCRPAACPDIAATWCTLHFEYEWRCVRRPTLDAGVRLR